MIENSEATPIISQETKQKKSKIPTAAETKALWDARGGEKGFRERMKQMKARRTAHLPPGHKFPPLD